MASAAPIRRLCALTAAATRPLAPAAATIANPHSRRRYARKPPNAPPSTPRPASTPTPQSTADPFQQDKEQERFDQEILDSLPNPKTLGDVYRNRLKAANEASADVRGLLAEMSDAFGLPPTGSGGPGFKGMGHMNPAGEVDRDLWAADEDPDVDEFDEDDILSMAHLKLEEHREYRNYARVAAWEMPLLAKFAKEYKKPQADQVLRFRHTTYMGEYHPAERKVVVEFCPDDIPFPEEWQVGKLKKLAGARYNPERNVVKMSCDSYEHAAQNKRRLGDLVNKLVEEAMDPADKFEDVPLDFRYHKFVKKPKFPAEWRMTDSRMEAIEGMRAQAALLDAKPIHGDRVVVNSYRQGKNLKPVNLPTAGVSRDLPEPAKVPEEEKVPELVAIDPQGRTPPPPPPASGM